MIVMIYLLYYDRDSGNREDWNVFYTPCEAFSSELLRKNRMDFIKTNYPELEFHTLDMAVDPYRKSNIIGE